MLRHTVLFSALLMLPQSAISSIVRVQPLHRPVLASITQTETHGEGTEGIGAARFGVVKLFKIALTVVDASTARDRREMN
jgi:hypothetical protein